MTPLPTTQVCLFARVSTGKQDYERQIRELSLYTEQRGWNISQTIAYKISGTKTKGARPDLDELFEAADKNLFSKVVICEIQRLGRNAKDIRKTISFLHDRKISVVFKNFSGLESLDEKGNETLIMNIIIAVFSEFAEEEKRDMSLRIKSGLANAVANGKVVGRPVNSCLEDKELLKKYSRLAADLRKGHLSIRKNMKLHSLSQGTVVKVRRLVLSEQE